MNEQPVDRFERDLRQVLVRAVDRVSRLEADDALPAALGELSARLEGRLGELRKRRLRELEDGDASRDVQRALLV